MADVEMLPLTLMDPSTPNSNSNSNSNHERIIIIDNGYGTTGRQSAVADAETETEPEPETPEEGEEEEEEEEATVTRRRHRKRIVWCTLSLGISILLGLVSGTLYGFGRYSRDLRDTLHISQLQVQRFGILLDTGNYIGHPLTGFVYDRWGPRVSCISAAVVVFLSYGSIHWVLSSLHVSSSSPPPLWIMDVGFMGVGFGSGLGYIAALASTTKQFLSTPHYLGRAVAVVAAGYGLSSTLVGISYHHYQIQVGNQQGLRSFFLLWAYLVAVVNMLGAIIYTGKQRHDDEEEEHTASSDAAARTCCDEGTLERNRQDVGPSELHMDENNDLVDANALEERLLSEHNRITVGGSLPAVPWTSWRLKEFWLLFASFACITGCGLFVINNVSTMVQSIGGNDSLTGTLVFLLSICNVCGRILMGSLADHGTRYPKLDLYRYASLLMAMALLVGAIGGTSPICLALTVGTAAIAYGGSWVLIVGILAESDLYGQANFGKDYGLMAMGPAVSGMIFNSLSARLYQYHAAHDNHDDDDDDLDVVCLGANCYRDAYLVTAASALVGFLILTWMPARPTVLE